MLPGLEKLVSEQINEQSTNNQDSVFDFKQTTMHDNARSAEKVFEHARPSLVCDEGQSADTLAPDVVAEHALDHVLSMSIKM
eukprot:2618376-Karenia_brevis.AAC.1